MKRNKIIIGIMIAASILVTACGSKTVDNKSTGASAQSNNKEEPNKTTSNQTTDNSNTNNQGTGSESKDTGNSNSQNGSNSNQNSSGSKTTTNSSNNSTNTSGNSNSSNTNSQGTTKELTSSDAIEKVKKILGAIPSGHYVTYDTDVTQNGKNYFVIHYYEVVTDNAATGDSHTVTYGWYYVDKSNGEVYSMDQATGSLEKIK